MTKLLLVLLPVFAVLSAVQSAEPVIPSEGKALAVHHPMPVPPLKARLEHMQGSGMFAFHLRPDGTVERVEILQSTGHALLDQVCVETFSQWRFARGAKTIKIPITFH